MFSIILCLLIIIALLGGSLYFKQTTGLCENSKHLVGKVVIVTGASSGIGFETALDLAQRGARVILANHHEKYGISARDKIIAQSGNSEVCFRYLDLLSFKSIITFANSILSSEKRLDILINNAGAFYDGLEKTEDGLLAGMQVNYFGPFLLTNLLLPLLIASGSSRIINVSSIAYKFGRINLEDLNLELSKAYFKSLLAYANSKWCMILMTIELNRRLQGTGVTVYALHPGFVETSIVMDDSFIMKIARILCKPYYKTPRVGAQTTLFLAVSTEVEGLSGCYFEDCERVKINEFARNVYLARKLWDVSEKMVLLKQNVTLVKKMNKLNVIQDHI